MADSDKIELHTKFFNAEKVLYSAMNPEQRLNHRQEMAMLIFEARARMNAIDDFDREEKGKLSKDGKTWLVNNEEVNSSDALNQPKIRKERMSKADKIKESLTSLGLDASSINSIIGQVQKTATDKNLNNITWKKESEPSLVVSELCRITQHESCPGRFTDNSGSHSCDCECHKVLVSANGEEKPKPFNPADLFGK